MLGRNTDLVFDAEKLIDSDLRRVFEICGVTAILEVRRFKKHWVEARIDGRSKRCEEGVSIRQNSMPWSLNTNMN